MTINRATNVPEITAHITFPDNGNFPKTVRGYAIDKRTGAHGRLIRRSAKEKQDIECVVDEIIYTIQHETRTTRTASLGTASLKGEKLNDDNPLSIAFMVAKHNPELFENWREGTFNRAMTQFENRFLPFLLDCVGLNGSDIVFNSEKLLNHLMDFIMSSKKSKGILSTNERTAHSALASAQKIYNVMCLLDRTLPRIDFGVSWRKTQTASEQLKSLPLEINLALAKGLSDDIDRCPKFVAAAVLMYDAGLRTAEAAAVIPSKDVICRDEITIVNVLFQEKSGKRSEILKTDNAYRMVPLSFWGSTVIKKCMTRIKEPDNNYDALVKSSDLSAYIKKKLIDAGLKTEFWERFREEEAELPERDSSGKAIFDTTAYVLRRNRASLWQHVCALTGTECDYLLGHINDLPASQKPDFRLISVLKEISQKLERFVVDPSISRHPGLHPIEMKHGLDLELIPFEKTRLINTGETPLCVSLHLSAAVPGERIDITSSNDAKWDGNASSARAKLDQPRTIIGHAKGVDEYED